MSASAYTAPERAPRSSRRPVGSWPWLMCAAVAVAVLFTSLNLSGVLRGFSWLPPVVFTVTAVLVSTAAARAVRTPPALVPLAGLLGLTVSLTVQFLASASFLGVLPNNETYAALQRLLFQANEVVISQIAPVEPLDGIVLVACAGVGLVALLVDALAIALRMPATSGLGLLTLLLVPAIVKPSSIGAAGFAAAIIGFLVVLGAAHLIFNRGERASTDAVSAAVLNRALTIGAAGIAAALIVPLAIPGFSSGLFPEGSRLSLGAGSGLNPMITLGNDLRNPGSVGRMTYITTSEDPVYLRAVTLESFDDDSWAPNPREDARESGVESMDGITMEFIGSAGEVDTTIIDTGEFVSPWLPTPYAPVQISGLRGQWSFDPMTLSVKGDNGTTTSEQRYSVRSVTPELTPQSLTAANQEPSERLDPQFLALPEQMPDLIGQTAAEVTEDTGNRYRKAMAIQQYLRSGDFTYSETAPVEGGYDGSSMDIVGRFLEEKSGYCVHYSAAMAVMARAEGIPSRIAVGYAPGTSTGETVTAPRSLAGVDELPQFAVDSDDAHAWPELYFEGLGWVPFEPTPSRGVVPDYAMAETTAGDPDAAPENLNPESLTDQNRDTNEEPAEDEEPLVRGGGDPTGGSGEGLLTGALTALAVLAGLGLLSVPALLRARLRSRRMSALASGLRTEDALSVLAWHEVTDSAADHGIPAQTSETPRAFGARLGRERLLSAEAAAAMRRLVHGFERAEYGRPPGGSFAMEGAEPLAPAGSVRTGGAEARSTITAQRTDPSASAHKRSADAALVLESLSRHSTRSQRLKARWLPASLRHRRLP